MPDPGDLSINVTMTPEQAEQFLTLLAEDDDFRRRFETDTEALLREWGIELPAELMPPEVAAPSKGSLRDAVDEIREGIAPAMPPHSNPPPHSWWLLFLARTRGSKR
jgi:putative modified peptide